jgi:ABC-type uncharacterized transport system fused permease/ATPase subunit
MASVLNIKPITFFSKANANAEGYSILISFITKLSQGLQIFIGCYLLFALLINDIKIFIANKDLTSSYLFTGLLLIIILISISYFTFTNTISQKSMIALCIIGLSSLIAISY